MHLRELALAPALLDDFDIATRCEQFMANDSNGSIQLPPEMVERIIRKWLDENLSARSLLLDPIVGQARDRFIEALGIERNDIDAKKKSLDDLLASSKATFQSAQRSAEDAVANMGRAVEEARLQVETHKTNLENAATKSDTAWEAALTAKKAQLESRFNRAIIPLGLLVVVVMAVGSFVIFQSSLDAVQRKYEAASAGLKELQSSIRADQIKASEIDSEISILKPKLDAYKGVALPSDIAVQVGTHEQSIANIQAWSKAKDAAASASATKSGAPPARAASRGTSAPG